MARHSPVNKARWLAAQKAWLERWREPGLLEREMLRIEHDYAPVMNAWDQTGRKDATILDLGCGPTCPARFIKSGDKTWLDPMLDDFRRLFPGRLPKGRHLATPAEKIPAPDASFDCIICVDALDRFMNPELALHEAERVIRPDGVLILGLPTFPKPLVRARQFAEQFLPALRDEAHPYSYTLAGLRKTLERHFAIVEEQALSATSLADSRPFGREYAMVCKPRA